MTHNNLDPLNLILVRNQTRNQFNQKKLKQTIMFILTLLNIICVKHHCSCLVKNQK